ncbi:hypothetical protein AX16_007140 [Volvariella volvacea WC 439]|nr:hypothetical protein AX16_007140 [Volvariella volvacea WC 439]
MRPAAILAFFALPMLAFAHPSIVRESDVANAAAQPPAESIPIPSADASIPLPPQVLDEVQEPVTVEVNAEPLLGAAATSGGEGILATISRHILHHFHSVYSPSAEHEAEEGHNHAVAMRRRYGPRRRRTHP